MSESNPSSPATWILAAGLALALVGILLEPTGAQTPGGTTGPTPGFGTNQTSISSSAGGNADSNNRMIAVTGVDVTGSSILYLVDTIDKQLAIYQANGGSSSTQGVKLVGARRIDLDLRLDGFNDKTQSAGKALGYKDLKRAFSGQGHDVSGD